MDFRNCLLATTLLLAISIDVPAEELDTLNLLPVRASLNLNFEQMKAGGFERRKISKDFRIRGWQIGQNTYFGQTKVDDHWGVGFVFEKGDIAYGMNHRGIQFTRKLRH